MPDIGSSQNVQTVQEPAVNGNEVKTPNKEVSKILAILDDRSVFWKSMTIALNSALCGLSMALINVVFMVIALSEISRKTKPKPKN